MEIYFIYVKVCRVKWRRRRAFVRHKWGRRSARYIEEKKRINISDCIQEM
jgi:hypothetical protein